MDDLERLLRFWRTLDDRFQRVRHTAWGAVVTDERFPAIWDVNYARVEDAAGGLSLARVEAELLGELERTGARHLHIVLFHPEPHAGLLAEASTNGARLSWEVVMARRVGRPGTGRHRSAGAPVAEVRRFGPTFWRGFARSLREFDVTGPEAAEQLRRIEAEVLLPAGKRWFAIRESGRAVAHGALLALGDVALLDHVVTLPRARRRGYAEALVRRMCAEAEETGADLVWLLTDPGGGAERLYRRIGFEAVATIASTLRPCERPGALPPASTG